jgi:hypothetical protein
MSESTRALIYRVLVVLIPLLVAFGLVTDETAAALVAAVGGLFGAGLAAKNTSRKA